MNPVLLAFTFFCGFGIYLNHIGKRDIVCANDGSPNKRYKNLDNQGEFFEESLSERDFRTTSIFTFDMNEDGLMDVAETNLHNLNVYYLNRGEYNLPAAAK